jgi:transcriptional regulator with XRE-family HTH domain
MDRKALGRRLRAHRRAARLTQEDVSQRSAKEGVEPIAVGSISDWERGIRTPNLENLQRLARVFGTTLDELVGGSPGQRQKRKQSGQPLKHMQDIIRAAIDMLDRASREQDPIEAQRRATEALGVLRLALRDQGVGAVSTVAAGAANRPIVSVGHGPFSSGQLP